MREFRRRRFDFPLVSLTAESHPRSGRRQMCAAELVGGLRDRVAEAEACAAAMVAWRKANR